MDTHYPTDKEVINKIINESSLTKEQKDMLTFMLNIDSNFLTYAFGWEDEDERLSASANWDYIYTDMKNAMIPDLLTKEWEMSFGDIVGLPENVLLLTISFKNEHSIDEFLFSSGKFVNDTRSHFNHIEIWFTPSDAKKAYEMGIINSDYIFL